MSRPSLDGGARCTTAAMRLVKLSPLAAIGVLMVLGAIAHYLFSTPWLIKV